MTRRCLFLTALFILTLLQPIRLAAEDRASPSNADGTGNWKILVTQLGDPSFSARELAAQQLRAAGRAARPALVKGLKHSDLEVQLRAQQLLTRIEEFEFREQIARFLSDVGGDAEYGLPGWAKYRSIVADDRESREFFAAMLADEADLLLAVERGATAVAPMITDRVRSVQMRAARNAYQNADFSGANLAALLLASIEITKTDATTSTQMQMVSSPLYSLLNLHTARNMVIGDRGSRQVLKLMEHWIRASSDSANSYYGLSLSLKYNFQQTGREVARKTLEKPSVPASMLSQAAMTLGRFGDQTDVPVLERHFQDETVCHTWSNRQIQNDPIRIQARDVALAMALHLSGEDIKGYGYQFANRNTETIYDIYTLGFLKDEQRNAAFAKWQAWKEKQE